MQKKTETVLSERTEGRWERYKDKAGEALLYSTVYVLPWAGALAGIALVGTDHVIEGIIAASAGVAPVCAIVAYVGYKSPDSYD